MNRTLKFRCWDKQDKLWISTAYLECEERLGGVLSCLYHYDQPERFVIQQFTGLLDKSGKEVYEGDILLYDSSPTPCAVRWTNEDEDFHPGFKVRDVWSQYGLYEVISNIFENKELLK